MRLVLDDSRFVRKFIEDRRSVLGAATPDTRRRRLDVFDIPMPEFLDTGAMSLAIERSDERVVESNVRDERLQPGVLQGRDA